MSFRNRTSMNALRILCAIVLLFLGVGHKPVEAAASVDAYSEAYRLPDGTFADICADGHDEHDAVDRPLCEVCLLASSVILPLPADDDGSRRALAFLVNRLPSESSLPGVLVSHGPSARGPPLAI